MTCPSCGTIAAGGAERCPRCGGSLALPTNPPATPLPVLRAPTRRGELAQRAKGIVGVVLAPKGDAAQPAPSPARPTPEPGPRPGQPAPRPAPVTGRPAAHAVSASPQGGSAPHGAQVPNPAPAPQAPISPPAPAAPAATLQAGAPGAPAAPPAQWPAPAAPGWAPQPPPPAPHAGQPHAGQPHAPGQAVFPLQTGPGAPAEPTAGYPPAPRGPYAPPSYAPPSYAPPTAPPAAQEEPAADPGQVAARNDTGHTEPARPEDPGRHAGRAEVDPSWPPPPGPWTSGRPASES